MRKPASFLIAASAVAALLGAATLMPEVAVAADAKLIEQGKKVAEDRRKGNCFACHAYEGIEMPGNIGPPLIAMKARFPDRAKLRAQIWDATAANPNSMMPPFGKHEVLSAEEIDAIVEWVYTL